MSDLKKIDGVELTAAEKLAQFEKEKLTRRQALARFGFQAGAAAVAALTADDLLRAVGKEMRNRAGDNKVAQQVASEFEKAGMAHALAIPVCDENGGCTACITALRNYNHQHCGGPVQICEAKTNNCITMCADVNCNPDDEENKNMSAFIACIKECAKSNGTMPGGGGSGYGNCTDCVLTI
jgi:hypothetical protein